MHLRALTLLESTARKIEEDHATGRLVARELVSCAILRSHALPPALQPQHERWSVTRIGQDSVFISKGLGKQFRASRIKLGAPRSQVSRKSHPEQRVQVTSRYKMATSLCSACGPTCIVSPEG